LVFITSHLFVDEGIDPVVRTNRIFLFNKSEICLLYYQRVFQCQYIVYHKDGGEMLAASFFWSTGDDELVLIQLKNLC
jgi:hypothetical protein